METGFRKVVLEIKNKYPAATLRYCHWQIFSEKWLVKKLKNSQETISRIWRLFFSLSCWSRTQEKVYSFEFLDISQNSLSAEFLGTAVFVDLSKYELLFWSFNFLIFIGFLPTGTSDSFSDVGLMVFQDILDTAGQEEYRYVFWIGSFAFKVHAFIYLESPMTWMFSFTFQRQPPELFYKGSCSLRFRNIHSRTVLLKRDSNIGVFLWMLRNI